MTTSLMAQTVESDLAKLPLQNYVRAHETGDGEFIRRAFTTDAKVVGYMNGELISWSVEDFVALFGGKPAADEAKRKRSIEIVEITGDAAVGRVVLDYPSVKFVDYMALLKIDGQWKITHKSFNAQPKAPQ